MHCAHARQAIKCPHGAQILSASLPSLQNMQGPGPGVLGSSSRSISASNTSPTSIFSFARTNGDARCGTLKSGPRGSEIRPLGTRPSGRADATGAASRSSIAPVRGIGGHVLTPLPEAV
jgi:hypothetical protein